MLHRPPLNLMPGPITALQLVTDAFLDAGIVSAGEPLAAEDSAFGLSKLSRLLDTWSAEKLNIFAVDFLELILVPNIQPLLIGLAAQIAQASLTSNVATFLAKNSYKSGDYIDVSGCITATFNVSNVQVTAATPTQFQVAIIHADIVPEAEAGALAVYTGTTPPTYPLLTQRPTQIENANIVLNNISPIVKVPLRVHNNMPGADWWSGISVPTVPSTIPTDLFYNPQWPNGFLYLWPMQSQNYGLELETWVNLADIPSLSYPFYLPQGYRDAVTYNLAISVGPSYEKPPSPALAALAISSQAAIMARNSKSPAIVTRDSGLPSGARKGTYLNWLSGQVVPGR